jgi:hypothetical protein
LYNKDGNIIVLSNVFYGVSFLSIVIQDVPSFYNVRLVMEIKTDMSYCLVTLRGKVYIYSFILKAFLGSDIVYFGEK